MRTIIAGTRSDRDLTSEIWEVVQNCGWKPTVVLCGMAKGPDSYGEVYGKQRDIPIEYYPANWSKFGKGAGFIRNTEMALKADALIALWDGVSRGTGHMIDQARANNLKIHVHWFTP